MTVDVTAIWKAVADSTWGEQMHCWECGNGYYGRIWKAWERAEEGYEEESGREDRELFVGLVHGLVHGLDAIMLP